MQVARKATYAPYENESGRFWLRIGGRTFNFIMTNEKEKEESGADPSECRATQRTISNGCMVWIWHQEV
ncbi:hypothetical protein OCU04_003372 [Sclerotinia nivalis]|uniref:Uncharacterized protein n=1 Tax=Sclerotinia nivalis TaxID=352851 RepID=A0A9X0DLA1_9HELO|nr:hypothetical protein OCU04_003372 [Sclerotinia nivalis]